MWKLDHPTADSDQVYEACVSGVKAPDLKTRLHTISPLIAGACAQHREAAVAGSYNTIPMSTGVGNVSGEELRELYERRMARKGSHGRQFYELIMAGPLNRRCPLCGHRRVTTLDHHLPQSRYPALCVAPLNLVPACQDCNKAKLDQDASAVERTTINPYFDDIQSKEWLKAKIREEIPISFDFWVDPPNEWPAYLGAKLIFHFNKLKLNELYKAEAADEIYAMKGSWSELFERGGATELHNHLKEMAEVKRKVFANWWLTATYDAMQASAWFCEGAFWDSEG